MMEQEIRNEPVFFITSMPDSRPADYYLGCWEGSVFLDFDTHENERICLKRISFDGFGCCELEESAIPMNEPDSREFKEIIEAQIPDQSRLTAIIKKAILNNRGLIWKDALSKYDLA